MAILLSGQGLGHSHGSRKLFEGVSLGIGEGDRLGLIGPNGAGKTTLLEILAGSYRADEGDVSLRRHTRLGYVRQQSEFAAGLAVRDVVAGAIAGLPLEDGERQARIETALGRASFARGDEMAASLSGGWKKRLSIAAALVLDPDILLLDEPTNHLDIEGALWLERLLTSSRFACLFVTHDRYFLENVATRVAEINRTYPGGLFTVDGDYPKFLEKKQEFLDGQERRQEVLANQVRREIEWLRRGPKARTGKSRARIDSAGRLIEELAEVSSRNRTATAQIDFVASERKTRKLVAGAGIEKSFDGKAVLQGVDFILKAGVRLGLVGANGSGKSTLLKMVSGELRPGKGELFLAENLRVVIFEQARDSLDPSTTLRRALCPDGDSVIYRGRPVHVNGWARRFLFEPEQMEQPVGNLSGGERARVFIARLMLQEADVLLLDEPANDLDIPTLEVLEETLLEFPGAMILVTHDRYLLDRVSTAVLGLDSRGRTQLFAEYSQWLAWKQQQDKAGRAAPAPEPAPAKSSGDAAPQKKRLSYLEQREFDEMEARILQAEEEAEARLRAAEDPAIVSDGLALKQRYDELEAARAAVEKLYARWAELEAKLR